MDDLKLLEYIKAGKGLPPLPPTSTSAERSLETPESNYNKQLIKELHSISNELKKLNEILKRKSR